MVYIVTFTVKHLIFFASFFVRQCKHFGIRFLCENEFPAINVDLFRIAQRPSSGVEVLDPTNQQMLMNRNIRRSVSIEVDLNLG